MKSKSLPIPFFVLFVITLLFSCAHNDEEEPFTDRNIKDFIWKGLNSWYYWQEEVPLLADNLATEPSYIDWLNSSTSPSEFFRSVLYDYPNTDRFSIIVSDYDQLLGALQGTGTSFGFELGLALLDENSNEVLGYVKYVLPGSNAQNSGLHRGDFFTRVNGITLTTDNYVDLIYGNSNFNIELADYSNGDFVSNGTIITVSQETLAENPVYYTQVYGTGSNKVGYLVYNGFTYTYNQELNDAFTYFQSENISNLILDLRYNPGGSVSTATYLASMILGEGNTSVFAKSIFNSKHQEDNKTYFFTDQYTQYGGNGDEIGTGNISSVNINSVTILTTYNTASASELIINGLTPYIAVTLIGTTTRGKDVGSTVLFDSPYQDFISKSNANTHHKYAMLPIVFKIFNANNEGNYSNGFTPDMEINELQHIDTFLELGNPDETLLQAALNLYGLGRPSEMSISRGMEYVQEVPTNTALNPVKYEMYANFPP